MFTSGPGLWLILLTIGVIALGGAMAYGLTRNRTRTRGEEVRTEAATRQQYADEEYKTPPR
ncbi:MAG TPA: hypothetical protein VGN60_01870 [Devosia sp.]|jgi:hypothetical protein|nr:hypothetical protein [Devosia sp.]